MTITPNAPCRPAARRLPARWAGLLLVLGLLLLALPRQAVAQKTATVQGTLLNVPAGAPSTMLLFELRGNERIPKGKISLKGNTFAFQLQVPDGVYRLGFDDQQSVRFVLAGGENLNFTYDFNTPLTEETLVIDSPENTAFRQMQDVYLKYIEAFRQLALGANIPQEEGPNRTAALAQYHENVRQLIETQLNAPLAAIRNQYPKTYAARVLYHLYRYPEYAPELAMAVGAQNPSEFYLKRYFSTVDPNDPGLPQNDVWARRVSDYLKMFTAPSLDGIKASVDIIMQTAQQNAQLKTLTVSQLITLFTEYGPIPAADYIMLNYFSDCEAPSENTQYIVQFLEKFQPGKPIPDLTLPDRNGTPQAVSQHLGPGATLFIAWSSRCPHCMDFMPTLAKLSEQYAPKGLKIYAASIDENKAEWTAAVDKFALQGSVHVSDLKGWKSELLQRYPVRQTPFMLLADSKGIIVAKDIGDDQLRELLAKTLP